MVGVPEARKIAIQVYGSNDAVKKIEGSQFRKEEARFQRQMEEWHRFQRWGYNSSPIHKMLSTVFPDPEKPPRPWILDIPPLNERINHLWQSMSATDLPYWDQKNNRSEAGVYCASCVLHFTHSTEGRWYEFPVARKPVYQAYLPETILQHFKECGIPYPWMVNKDVRHFYRDYRENGCFFMTQDGQEVAIDEKKVEDHGLHPYKQ
jgi:hypothetical protein